MENNATWSKVSYRGQVWVVLTDPDTLPLLLMHQGINIHHATIEPFSGFISFAEDRP